MPANSLDLLESGNTTWSWKPTTDGGTGSAKVRTPRVNPYAAPQTIDGCVDETALPMAVMAESDGTRQLYPEQSTEVLEELARKEGVLIAVQSMWIWVTGLLSILSLHTLTTLAHHTVESGFYFCGLPAMVVPFAGVRLYAGYARNKSDRYFAIGMDWLLFTASLGLTLGLIICSLQTLNHKGASTGVGIVEVLFFILGLPLLFYFGYSALNSVKALSGGKLLFGSERIKYTELVQELAYRRLHGIE